MKPGLKFLTAAAMTLPFFAACGGDTENDDEHDGDHLNPPGIFDLDAGPPAEPLILDSVFYDAVDEEHPQIADTNVRLVRDPNAETLEAKATTWSVKGLTPGDVVTVWWVFFTNTDDCEAGIEVEGFNRRSLCGPPDLQTASVVPGFGYAGPAPMGGAIVDENGEATFPDLATPVVDENATNADFLIGNGIRDLFKSEIHIVLRTHGPEITDNETLRDAQLGTFNGGCETGEPNEGMCQNVQFAYWNPYY